MKDILIIGFGASSLNVRALLSASHKHSKRVHYLDSMDSHYVESVLDVVDLASCVTYIISKSGSTFETNLLAKLILERGAGNIKVICGNKESELAKIVSAVKHEWINFEGEKSGRFGLLTKPFTDIAASVEIDVEKLLQGTGDVDMDEVERKSQEWLKHFEEGRRIWVIMLYIKQCYGLFMWIRQIVSESLGKEGWGILPFLCEGSMDEHSQLQLFLDGPKDKFYEIISSGYEAMEQANVIMIGEEQHLQAKKVTKLLQGKDLAFQHIHHEKMDAYLVGKYIATYLNLVKLLGDKLGFDPMNQPAVESMKKFAHEN